MAPKDTEMQQLEDEFDFGLELADEFDALLVNVKEEDDVSEELASLGKYPAKLHAKRVAKELASQHGITSGLVFLPGEPTRYYEDSDMSPTFHQRRYFYYLSGANFPGCSLTYDISTSTLILWVPYVEPRQILWYGRTPSPQECLARMDVDDVRYASKMGPYITQTLLSSACPSLYLLHPSHRPPLTPETARGVRVDAATLLPCMDAARVVKTDYEVAMIRRANAVSSAAHRKVAKKLLSLRNEREIEAILRKECAVRGAKIQAYAPIAGSGENAATLHYGENDQPLKGRELVVIDAGCEWDCYASDITRTLPIRGEFSPEAGAVYKIVEKMQEECIAAVKPGRPFFKLHVHASAVATVGLMKLGILKGGKASEILNAGTVAGFFPHGLGHHVGLETHDVSGREKLLLRRSAERKGRREEVTPEDLKHFMPWINLSGRQKLEKNMIVTIEPGIYFCREYLEGNFLNHPVHSQYIDVDVLEKYYPVGGVRIEDDILVTEKGYENLTSAPKGEEMLRIINGE